jgi:hypothetical protein
MAAARETAICATSAAAHQRLALLNQMLRTPLALDDFEDWFVIISS